jgi:hypothetical protein
VKAYRETLLETGDTTKILFEVEPEYNGAPSSYYELIISGDPRSDRVWYTVLCDGWVLFEAVEVIKASKLPPFIKSRLPTFH